MQSSVAAEPRVRRAANGSAAARERVLAAFLRGPNSARAELAPSAAGLLRSDAEPVAVLVVDALEWVDPADDPSTPARRRHRSDALIDAVAEHFGESSDVVFVEMDFGEIAVLVRSGESEPAARVAGSRSSDRSVRADLTALKGTAAALGRYLATALRCEVRVGVGLRHRGLAGMVRSYQDARTALNGAVASTADRVHCLDGAGLAGIVDGTSGATRRALAQHVLAPLGAEPYLSKTLETYFAQDCSPGAAAAVLKVHRNTLSYRLGRIAALTGLDPRRFDEAVQLRVAMQLRRPEDDA